MGQLVLELQGQVLHYLLNKMEEDKQKEKKEQEPEKKQTDNSQKQESKQVDKASQTEKPKKTEAVVNGKDIPISTKYAVAICNYIRGKNIDNAISMLEKIEKMKKPIPMKGEISHKKGIMSGKYPVKAVREFVKLLKSLRANAIVNELELEKYKLFCKADIASRPYRRFGRTRFKRSHVQLKLIEPIKRRKNKGGDDK